MCARSNPMACRASGVEERRPAAANSLERTLTGRQHTRNAAHAHARLLGSRGAMKEWS